MPFTLSHPAAVVPLTRRGLVLSALVVGSMTIDIAELLIFSAFWQILTPGRKTSFKGASHEH